MPRGIAELERILDMAKAGKVRAVAIAFVTDQAPFTGSTSGLPVEDVALNAKLLLAAVEELRQAYGGALLGAKFTG